VLQVVVHEGVKSQALTDSPPAPGGLGYAFYSRAWFAADVARVLAAPPRARAAGGWSTTAEKRREQQQRREQRQRDQRRVYERQGDARLGGVGSQGETLATARGGVEEGDTPVPGGGVEEAAAAGDTALTEGGVEETAAMTEALEEEMEEEIEAGEKADAALGDSLEGDSLKDLTDLPFDLSI
jgi:hypothetical protein